MNQTANTQKKDMFYVIVLILTLITVIIGAAFAAYYFLHSQKEGSSAVYTGTLQIEYLSGNIISYNSIYPITNPKYDDTDNVYKNNFRVKNTGTLDSIIRIDAIINKNEFSDETLYYKLYNSSKEEIATGPISEGNGEKQIIEKLELPAKTEEEYTLIIWLKENGKNQNREMKKVLSGLLEVNANQKIE